MVVHLLNLFRGFLHHVHGIINGLINGLKDFGCLALELSKTVLDALFELGNVGVSLLLNLSRQLVDFGLGGNLDGLLMSLVHSNQVSHHVIKDTLRVVGSILYVAHGKLGLRDLLLLLECLPRSGSVPKPRVDDHWVETPRVHGLFEGVCSFLRLIRLRLLKIGRSATQSSHIEPLIQRGSLPLHVNQELVDLREHL